MHGPTPRSLHHLHDQGLVKAFDTVSRERLWRIMSKIGCPDKFIAIAHQGMTAGVRDGREQIDLFPVTNNVKHGCMLAQTLFSMMFSAKQNHAFRDCDANIKIW